MVLIQAQGNKETGRIVTSTSEVSSLIALIHTLISGQNHDMKMVNKSSENAAKFKYVGTIVTNQNSIHEGLENRLDYWDA
jgi:hypothetical protein